MRTEAKNIVFEMLEIAILRAMGLSAASLLAVSLEFRCGWRQIACRSQIVLTRRHAVSNHARRFVRLISFNEVELFLRNVPKSHRLRRVRQPRRGNRGEKRHDVDLSVAAGLFQNATHMRPDCVRGSAAIPGDGVHSFS